MLIPTEQPLVAYQGQTFNTTITLVSGSAASNPPNYINLTNYSAQFVVGPYMTLNSNNPSISGAITMGGTQGTITIVISGSATQTLYNPEPYYLELIYPNGYTGVLMNGTINFVSPFNQAIIPSFTPNPIGPANITIGLSDWQDFTV